jgi:hypothetical protein
MAKRKPKKVTQPMVNYEDIDAINWSRLKWMRVSPAHYHYWFTHPVEPSSAMLLGTAVHCAVLEPERFNSEFTQFLGVRRGGDWDAFVQANPGKRILKPDDFTACQEIAAAVRRHPVANHLLNAGEAEKIVAWTDEKTGLRLKGRIDWYNGLGIVDLKTSYDIDPFRFNMSAAKFGYHAQCAYYRRGLRALGIDAPAKILAVETSPPYDVVVYSLSDDDLYAGDQLIDALLTKVIACHEANHWPGRAAGEVPLQLPAWAWTESGIPASEGTLPNGLVFGD